METALFIFLLAIGRNALCKQTHTFDGDVIDFAVGSDKLFVLTATNLYQMKLNLNVERHKEISNASNKVRILLPFSTNNSVIVCGSHDLGYCEILDIYDISRTIHKEPLDIGTYPSVAFIVGQWTSKYLLVGKNGGESSDSPLVSLRDTKDGQFPGGIFSKTDFQGMPYAGIQNITTEVQIVDGFQLDASSHVCMFVNVKNKVKLLSLDSKDMEASSYTKADTFNTLQGAVLQCCEGNKSWTLMSSAVIPGESPILWAGVFQDKTNQDKDTVVAVFDISRSRTGPVSGFCVNKESCSPEHEKESNAITDKVLRPMAEVFRYSSITSVAALKSNSWIVLFFGTGTGLLIKVVLSESLKPGYPTVMYSSDEDRQILPKMLFVPVNHTDIYIAVGNQVRRVPVSQCGTYQSLVNCWSAMNPFCGWCASTNRCTFQHDCFSSNWVSVPGTSQQREMISVHMKRSTTGQDIMVTAAPNLNRGVRFSCALERCDRPGPSPCSCTLSRESFPAGGLTLRVTIRVQRERLTQEVHFKNCLSIKGRPTSDLCMECFSAGCLWSGDACTWRTASTEHSSNIQDVCQNLTSGYNSTDPEIVSMIPTEVSIYGRNSAVITGRNLKSVTKIRFQQNMHWKTKESPVLFNSKNGSVESLTFHIPPGTKGTVRVCVVTPDGWCHGNTELTYDSEPTCSGVNPSTLWASGGRVMSVVGSKLKFVEKVKHTGSSEEVTPDLSSGAFVYSSPPAVLDSSGPRPVAVMLLVGNYTVICRNQLTYHPDPQFTSFTTTRTGNDMSVSIQKTADSLVLSVSDIKVQAMQGEESHDCVIEQIERSNDITTVVCDIREKPGISIDSLKITVGYFSVTLAKKDRNLLYLIPLFICMALAVCVVVVVVLYLKRKKQRMLMDEMNDKLEMIERDIRTDIHQGFEDMQTERSEQICSTGAIPFLDYKHFASRIFFPEGGPLAMFMMKDITQLSVREQQDQRCRALSHLIRDQLFLTSFVHALEEQKNFHVKDKCMVASLLTLALHNDLPYLTQVLEQLLVSLMEQLSYAQHKLLLRHTESIVEKLLTNWMSICLYGFLRECVGQPLYLLVCALTEQISKGPVDSVTGKALNTLNEDWLLWQAPDFSPLKLTVLFAVGTEGELSEPLEICALDCDTVEQVKEKILLTFHRKFGFRYTQLVHNIDIEYEQAGCYVALQEVDDSSEVMEEVTMLNTLKHYNIPDGGTIKVINRKAHAPQSPTLSLKEEPDFQIKYFHLIGPELAENKQPERKKLKVKEVYLTKLLSTKVAVHSYVENLFRTIWGTSNNNRPLQAVKYFFDFLDTQAESKKIIDPDVLHSWKTNSLPLRFWVNILKNPQFVFDLEKTPHLDGCLSVIAQAFMDCFSLKEQQLGKHAPTNKLLYAKDIPQYRQEVKAFYKKVKEQSALSRQEFKDFLQEESKKHENEFNDSTALLEIYKFIVRYFNEIAQKLEQNRAPSGLKEELQQVKELFESKKKSSWD